MKNYLKTLISVFLPVLGGLIIGSILTALAVSAYTELQTNNVQLLEWWEDVLVTSLLVILFGALPVFLYGWPLYAAIILLNGKASYFSSMLIVAIPSFIFLVSRASAMGGFILFFGIPIALCTHALANRFYRTSMTKLDKWWQ